MNITIRIRVSRNQNKLFKSLVCMDEYHTSGSMKELGVSGSRTGWQGGHVSKLWLKSASLVFFLDIYANPLGHAATPHCFAHLAKLKSVKQVKFFLHTLAFLPFGWQLLTWHMCITFLSIISAMTAALTLHRHRLRWIVAALDCQKDLEAKAFLTEGNKLRSGELHFPPYIHFMYWQLRDTDNFQLHNKDQF